MTRLYEITNGGYTGPKWLCGEHVEARRAAGWTVKVGMPLPEGSPCGDCELRLQSAPGYTTPTPDYVPTAPDSYVTPAPKAKRRPATAPVGMFDESEAA